MADFKQAFAVVMVHEGGYANDPDDTGGETYKGISRRNFPGWKGWSTIDLIKQQKPRDLNAALQGSLILQASVLLFYKINFWDVLQLDSVNSQAIATELFDTAVNCGVGVAGNFLQVALNALNNCGKLYPDLSEDGKIGPATVKALNGHAKPGNVLKLLNCLQGARYVSIARNRPKNEKFMNSWLSRVSL